MSVETAGARSQRPMHETSRTSIPGSARSFASRSSEPCSQQDRSWQQATSVASGGEVRKWG